MTFGELLNQYIEELGCSAKELAEASGLPAAVLSRYRSGTRIPPVNSENLPLLAAGIAKLSKNTETDSAETILAHFTALIEASDFDYDLLIDNLNLLIEATDINVNSLARFMNYDASFISRIRTRQRRPANPDIFADSVCQYVSNFVTDKNSVAALIGKPLAALDDQRVFYIELRHWLCSEKAEKSDSVGHFLRMLDQFDLNDYIRSIHFDELKVPSVPFQLPTNKSYYGVAEMRSGELDFFKATVLSHSTEPVFMCSDMDVEDMAEDVDFSKKWMFAIAMCLKKGLHLNMIHTIDRPFDELMLGLEGWIPIYMTGQISPYYLKNARSSVYQHLNYVSGAAALTGECIAGQHGKGKYYLTKKQDEIAYYREKSELLLKKALPLMEIYHAESHLQFEKFAADDAKTAGKRHGILSAPPIYTISIDLLTNILLRGNTAEAEVQRIIDYVHTVQERMEGILQENIVFDEIPHLSAEEFSDHPVTLSLEGLFLEKEFPYSYEEYCQHLKATALYAETHENYSVSFDVRHGFRNIQILIHEGEFAAISKSNAPVVHFVIRQQKLREAIENLVIPIVEAE